MTTLTDRQKELFIGQSDWQKQTGMQTDNFSMDRLTGHAIYEVLFDGQTDHWYTTIKLFNGHADWLKQSKELFSMDRLITGIQTERIIKWTDWYNPYNIIIWYDWPTLNPCNTIRWTDWPLVYRQRELFTTSTHLQTFTNQKIVFSTGVRCRNRVEDPSILIGSRSGFKGSDPDHKVPIYLYSLTDVEIRY